MQIQYSFRAVDKEFHEPWQRALGNVIERDLKPLLDKHTKDSVRLQIVLDRDKTKRQFLASGYMHLPGKKIVSVTASHDELTPLAQMLAQSLWLHRVWCGTGRRMMSALADARTTLHPGFGADAAVGGRQRVVSSG